MVRSRLLCDDRNRSAIKGRLTSGLAGVVEPVLDQVELISQFHFDIDVIFVHSDVAVVDTDTDIFQILGNPAPFFFASGNREIFPLESLAVRGRLT